MLQNNEPLAGLYDLQFVLYDAAAGGHQLGVPCLTNGVPISGGLFGVQLDFGAVFDGTGRWLEISVRTNDAPDWNTLAPRQYLAAVPQALHAATADLATRASTGLGMTNVGPVGNEALELSVYGWRGLRLEPTTAMDAPNVIAGVADNRAGSNVVGATIGGGGAAPIFLPGRTIYNHNEVTGDYGVVAGGLNNVVAGRMGVISGGMGNLVDSNALAGVVPGGDRNYAGGANSLAAGHRARAKHDGTFVWADRSEADFGSSGSNQFLIRAGGGVGIGVTNPAAALDVDGTIKASAFSGSGALLSPGTVGATQLAPGAAAANLTAQGQSGVPVGGMLLSELENSTNLAQAGYVQVARLNLVEEKWTQDATGPEDLGGVGYDTTRAPAFWTGTELLLVRQGNSNTPTAILRYNPGTEVWAQHTNSLAPKQDVSAVWSGTELILWGTTGTKLGGGMRNEVYTMQVADIFGNPTTVIVGGQVVGYFGEIPAAKCGVRFDPATGNWSPIRSDGPWPTVGGFAAWCGDRLLMWVAPALSTTFAPVATVIPAELRAYHPASDSWSTVALPSSVSNRSHPSAVWTGTELIVWGGWDMVATGPDKFVRAPSNGGARYRPTTGQWVALSNANAPAARYRAASCWTGTEMLIWGGWTHGTFSTTNVTTNMFFGVTTNYYYHETNHACLTTGGRYNPATGQWTAMQSTGAPGARGDYSSVWVGDRWIIWGGNTAIQNVEPAWSLTVAATNDGAAYIPGSNSWFPVSSTNAPAARMLHSAAWTGWQMLVWGGYNPDFLQPYHEVGGRYTVSNATWVTIPSPRQPGAREAASVVWTGSELLVWGGTSAHGYLDSGAAFNPVLNRWRSFSRTGAPAGRTAYTAVWTGTEMLIWGGDNGQLLGTGARYNPVQNTWRNISTTGAPLPRRHHTAIWTGTEMLIWGGEGPAFLGDGARYNPALDSWAPISSTNGPAVRTGHTAVWTGEEMLIWGGTSRLRFYNPPNPPIWLTNFLATGARYSPASNTWAALSYLNAPEVRTWHTAAWTGSELLVWGGTNMNGALTSGGRYSLASDTWTALPQDGPSYVVGEDGAVWDGSQLLVIKNGRGGERFHPALNQWITMRPHPGPRTNFVAAWAGSEVLVWGGRGRPGNNEYGAPQYLKETWSYTPPRRTYLYVKP
jgi:N-acetylneuraminic acid mutarotase